MGRPTCGWVSHLLLALTLAATSSCAQRTEPIDDGEWDASSISSPLDWIYGAPTSAPATVMVDYRFMGERHRYEVPVTGEVRLGLPRASGIYGTPGVEPDGVNLRKFHLQRPAGVPDKGPLTIRWLRQLRAPGTGFGWIGARITETTGDGRQERLSFGPATAIAVSVGFAYEGRSYGRSPSAVAPVTGRLIGKDRDRLELYGDFETPDGTFAAELVYQGRRLNGPPTAVAAATWTTTGPTATTATVTLDGCASTDPDGAHDIEVWHWSLEMADPTTASHESLPVGARTDCRAVTDVTRNQEYDFLLAVGDGHSAFHRSLTAVTVD